MRRIECVVPWDALLPGSKGSTSEQRMRVLKRIKNSNAALSKAKQKGKRQRRYCHNFSSMLPTPVELPVKCLLSRVKASGLGLSNEAYISLSFESDNILKGMPQRIFGLVVAFCRNLLPADAIDFALDSNVILPILPEILPNFVFPPELNYGLYEATFKLGLSPRLQRGSETEHCTKGHMPGFGSRDVVVAAHAFRRSVIARMNFESFEKSLERMHVACVQVKKRLEAYKYPTPLVLELPLPPPPEAHAGIYLEVLELLRAASASGQWPSSTPRRDAVIHSDARNKDKKGGTFTLGAVPGGLIRPCGNVLFPGLMKAAFRLEQVISPNRPASSTIAVNRSARFMPHRDSGIGNGQTVSMIVGLGDYVGGEVCVEGKASSIRYKPLEFDGFKQRHWTMPFAGERFSLVFFTPLGCTPLDIS